ncbi:class I adenylate-forming enzyme family protein [Bradyrhizobium sp.]|jgi:non-ribosomal peptide synthetase component E (peptide arylation enzyme)|uniref:class I adenylate-forming enzyme family protein n=1 Tax=Bradyrhizobium sp. TaxID=376 RepID=UPI003C57495F
MAYVNMLPSELAAEYAREKLWMQKTVFDILAEQAAAYPDRIAITDPKGAVSYGRLKDRIERAAQFYRSIGVRRGDVVTIQLPNRIDFAVAFIALELLGAIANKVNPDFRARELDYMLKFSGSSAYVFPKEWKDFDYAGMARGLQQANPELKRLIVAGGPVEGMHDFDAGVAASAPISVADRVHMDPNEVCRMCFTSGTTGNPKCALHSFNTTLYAVELLNTDMEVTEREVFLAFLPLGLNWGYITLLQSILAGARLVLMERFNPRAALELIQNERVTYIPTAPAGLVGMLNAPGAETFDVSSLRVVITGGASAAVETIREYQKRMKGHLIELYGMLEAGFQTYTRFSDDPQKVNGTIGRPVRAMELRIVDTDWKDVRRGEVGELASRGPSIHLGYHNNLDANAQAFNREGWFRTGDLGRVVDADGNVQITGRSKEIINRGGKKFFPREVEEILYAHPQVLHVAMIGMPDVRLGERNCLCVVPKGDKVPTLDEFVAFLRDQVADYKLPESVEKFGELPMTGSGKIQRHVLRDLVLQRHAIRTSH